MSANEYKKLFIQFLKDNNVLKEFKENIIKRYTKSYQRYANGLILYKSLFEKQSIIALYVDPITFTLSHYSASYANIENSLYYILNDSFMWSETPQGYKFWEQLDLKWRQLTKTKDGRKEFLGHVFV